MVHIEMKMLKPSSQELMQQQLPCVAKTFLLMKIIKLKQTATTTKNKHAESVKIVNKEADALPVN